MNKTPVTGIILTRNNEDTIQRALTSIIPLIQELVIVDDHSTDHTLDIIKSTYPEAKIYTRALDDHFANQRNFALSKANNQWVLMIDSDEEVSQLLKIEIETVLENPKYKAYISRRDNAAFDKWSKNHSGRPILLESQLTFENRIHETVKQTKLGYLKNILYHHSWTSVKAYVLDIIQYAKWQANDWYHKNPHYSLPYLVLRCFVSLPC
ncbi:MAG: glycosyltransferase family 2 protein, partial [Candidatus Margulisbacteria bacterium]|nr:glycosyltransferase family 2 protein [Candidatus Margulisiibacteriota bacterium]